MLNEVVFSVNHAKSSRRHGQCINALLVLLLVTLISISCGTVSAAPPNSGQPLVLAGTLPAGSVDQPYNAVLSVGGGASPYHFAIGSGVVPPGLTLNPTSGSFTGTPSTAGNYTFQVVVTDSPRPDQGTQSYSVTIAGDGGRRGGGIKVSVSPASVTLPSGGTQQFTANVTGTADTAVTWSASAGSINADGLYTAPNVKSITQATVEATSKKDRTKSASAAVTINPNQGQSLQITTSSLPSGQKGETYSATFSAAGGTQPYSWSVSAGNLPPGLALNTNGDLAGVPTTTGTFSFTVKVTDAKNLTATGNFSVTITTSSGYDGPAQLPLVKVPSSMADSPAPGGVVHVNAGGDLQSALNNAQCGETIQLQAGATFSGLFTVPAKNCDIKHWIIIRTSAPDGALPAEGQRLTPCYGGVASLMGRPAYNCQKPSQVLAKIQMTAPTNGPIQLANVANFYRFIGLEITRANGVGGSAVLFRSEGTSNHIIVDRSWVHGQAQDETRDGIVLNGASYVAIVDSYLNDFHCISGTGSCTDAHAIAGGNSQTQDGPFLIQGNFLEASGEGILFGGGPATTTPADIEVIGNHFFKPLQWMEGNSPFVGGPDGHPFIVKNHFELKNAMRVLVEANLMENSWGGFTQAGHGIVLSPTNQYSKGSGKNVCPICQVTDVTIRYTQVSHAGGGISMATEISPDRTRGAPALAGTRWSIHDLVFDDLSRKYVGGGDAFKIANAWPKNPLNTITINHVTAFPGPDSTLMFLGNFLVNPSMYGFVFTNNLALAGRYPVWNAFTKDSCAARDVPVISIANCFDTNTFQDNGLIASPAAFPPSAWPSGNYFPNTISDVGFVSYNNGNGGNYALTSSSPYKNKGSDGKDLGADIAGLAAALAGVD
jgi:Putative Ig domain/Bacterial Ig-like domain (group 2)